MEREKIACCYFPTTCILIDDNINFLNATAAKLSRDIVCKTYNNPKKALSFLTEKYQFDPFTRRCLLHTEDDNRDEREFKVNIPAIHREMYNADRFSEISVIVIDYAMPEMNGLEFCKQLQNSAFKFILLTGEADEKLAVKAFNEGLIHQFIRKDLPNYLEILHTAITKLQQAYFCDLSQLVIDSLTKKPEQLPCCLDDPTFIRFFNTFLAEQSVTEYYLMDEKGSFLFLNKHGIPGWLAVADEDTMLAYEQLTEFGEEAFPEMLAALKQRTHLVYMHAENSMCNAGPSDWVAYLHPVKKLVGKETYYYAHINDAERYDIHRKDILCYQDYLANL